MKYLKKFFNLTISLGASMVSSCGYTSDSNNHETFIEGQRMRVYDDYTGDSPIFIINDTIVSSTIWPNFNFSISKLNGDSISSIGYIVKKGFGPDESQLSMASYAKNRSLYVINTIGNRPSSFETYSMDGEQLTKYKLDSLSDMSLNFKNFIPLNDVSAIVIGFLFDAPKHLLTKIDFSENEIRQLNFWPDDEIKNNEFAKADYYTTNSSIFTNGEGKYLYNVGNTRQAFIFILKEDDVNIVTDIYDEPAKYSIASDGLNYYRESPYIGADIDATPTHIYSLVVDRHEDGTKDYPVLCYGDILEIFNWDGVKIATYKLDHLGYSIKYNTSDNSLLLFSSDQTTGNTVIWKYNL